jgi:glyoxylase-like metal-dependent hydrolase (beta-lactamase superfamily II)
VKIGNDLNIFIDRRFLVNSYLLTNEHNCIVIDPGLNDNVIDNFIIKNQLTLVGIILTHAHYDHIGNSFALAQKYTVRVYLQQDDKTTIEKYHFANELNMTPNINYDLIQYFKGNTLTINQFTFNVLLTKGHTPGGVVLKYHHYVFSGDTVFYDSIGRTDLSLGNMKEMQQSLKMFKEYCDDVD